jgi:hypothetical protein
VPRKESLKKTFFDGASGRVFVTSKDVPIDIHGPSLFETVYSMCIEKECERKFAISHTTCPLHTWKGLYFPILVSPPFRSYYLLDNWLRPLVFFPL